MASTASPAVPTTNQAGAAKKRNANPRSRASKGAGNPRGAAARNKAAAQFSNQEENQHQQPTNDPSRFAIANQLQTQQQQMNKVKIVTKKIFDLVLRFS